MSLKRREALLKPLLFGFLLVPGLSLGADNFLITAQPSQATYNVNQPITFTIQARTGVSNDATFSDVVTIGLYDNATIGSPSPSLTDGQALVLNVSGSVTYGVGAATVTFVNGAVTVKVIPKTGHDSEAFLVQDATITTGDNVGPFNVVGFSTTYFLVDAAGNTILASYPPNADILTTNSNAATAIADTYVDIPYSSDGSNAAALTIGGVNASYAFGGANISTTLWTRKRVAGGVANINYQVVLDYTGGVTDFNNVPASDTVYTSNLNDNTVAFTTLPQPSLQGGSAPLSTTTGLTNGQVILRIWSTSSPVSVISQLRIKTASASVTNASNITIPYSNLNAIVRANLAPKTVLISSPVTMVYNIQNLSSLQLGETKFSIPANPGGTGTPWTLSATPTTRGAGVTITYLNPSGVTNGNVDIKWGTSPVTINETASVTMVFSTASSATQTGWDFGFLIVKDTSTNNVNNDSNSAQNIQTLGVPSMPASFTAVPINFASPGTGNDISMGWAPVTDQNALGYVLSRSVGGGNFANAVTLPSGTIVPNAVTLTPPDTATSTTDPTAVNLTAYNYTLRVFNSVSESPATTVGPVTPFVNPATPGPVAALTGATSIQLNWPKPGAVGGSFPVAGYQVYRGTAPGAENSSPLTTVNSVAAAVTIADTTVVSGTQYYYYLSTIDNQYSSGPTMGPHDSGPSAEVNGWPPGNPPTSFASNLVSPSPATIGLSWAAPLNNLNAPVSYLLYKADTTTASPYAPLTQVASGTVTYNDFTSLVSGHVYGYYIQAKDTLGNLTNSVTLTQGVGPSAPTGVAATGGASSIAVTYNANAPSESVTDYILFRDAVQVAQSATTNVTDPSPSYGVTHLYTVEAVNNMGVTGPASSPGVPMCLLPNPPTPVVVSFIGASDSVSINWTDPDTNLFNYVMYRGPTAAVTGYTSPSAGTTNYLDAFTPAAAGSTIFYEIRAYNLAGYGSLSSPPAALQIPPNAPANLATNSTAATINLNWVANPASEHVTYYSVYRAPLPAGTPTLVATVTPGGASSYADGSASGGVSYAYYITATNPGGGVGIPGGPSLASNSVTAILAPGPPLSLAVTALANKTSMGLTWTAPAVATGITGYNVYRNSLNALPAGSPVTLPNAPLTYTDNSLTGATAGTTWFYFLQAQNAGGGGTTIVQAVQQPPNPPSSVTENSTASNIHIAWTANPASEAVSYYSIYRATLPAGAPSVIATVTPGGANSFIDNTASGAASYAYYVTATNPGFGPTIFGGESLPSNSVTGLFAPGPPASFTTTILANKNDAGLTWTAPVPATGITGYNVYRNTTNSLPAGPPVTLSGGTLNYTDVGLNSAGTTFFYFLQAQNAGGGGTTVGAALQQPPNAPVTVAPNLTNSTIKLNWAAGPVSEVVSWYTVYRATASGGPYSGVATVAAPGTSYTDSTANGLITGTTYYYKFTASNNGVPASSIPGGESVFSAIVTTGLGPQTPGGLGVTVLNNVTNPVSFYWNSVLTADPNAVNVIVTRNGSAAATLAPASVNYTDNSTVPDTNYSYTLAATNPFGTGANAPVVSVLTYPAAVSLMPVTLDADNVSRLLEWTTLPADVTSYNVYRQQLPSGPVVNTHNFLVAGLPFPSNPVKLTLPVQAGKSYVYWVTAVNATGEGPFSNPQTIGIAPSVPASVTAVSGISTGSDGVSLTWSPNSISENVTGYTVYRSLTQGTLASYVTAGGVTATTTNFTDGSVADKTIYYYLLAADEISGTESVLNTANSVAVTTFMAPNVPTGVSAVPGNGQATVSWSVPAATSYPVTGYNVLRVSGGVTQAANPPSIAAPPLTDTGLTNGTAYTYLAKAVDSQGHLSALSALSAPVTPIAPPAVPTPVGASAGNNANQITWASSIPGTLPVSFYSIQRTTLPAGPTVFFQAASTLTGYIDNTALNTVSYAYSVEAVDNNAVTTAVDVSGYSAPPVTVLTGLITVNPPNQVAAVGGNTQVVITWTDSVGSGAPVTGYQLFRGGVFLASINPGIQTYTDPGLTNGTSYSYYLVAYAGVNPSANSATVIGTPAAPPVAPSGANVVDGNNQATFSWGAVAPTGAVSIVNYVVLRGGSPITTVSGSVTSVLDSTITNGTSYNYQVEAVNSNGVTGALSGSITAYPYAPFVPGSFASSASANAVTFTFTPPGGVTWPPVGVYNLIRAPLGGGAPTTFPGSVASPIIDSSAVPGQLYVYTLIATDNKGNVSTAAGPITDGPATPPAAPTTFLVTAGSQQVLLDWSPAAPVTGEALPVSYIITYTGAHNGSVTLPGTQTTYLDDNGGLGLIDPAAVNYSIQVVDASGIVSSPAHVSPVTGPILATTASTDLNPPTGLTAKALGPKSIKLTWTLPNDLGRIVTGFNLYRSGSFITGTPPGSPITTLANPAIAPVTTFTDNSVSPNTTYYYVLRAVYAPSSTESLNSNNAWDTTPKPTTNPPPVTGSQMGFDANLLKPTTGQTLGIYYNIPTTGSVEIDIYNISGNIIRVLYPGLTQANTLAQTSWDGTDRNGKTVASGLYFIEIKSPDFHQIKKVAVVK